MVTGSESAAETIAEATTTAAENAIAQAEAAEDAAEDAIEAAEARAEAAAAVAQAVTDAAIQTELGRRVAVCEEGYSTWRAQAETALAKVDGLEATVNELRAKCEAFMTQASSSIQPALIVTTDPATGEVAAATVPAVVDPASPAVIAAAPAPAAMVPAPRKRNWI